MMDSLASHDHKSKQIKHIGSSQLCTSTRKDSIITPSLLLFSNKTQYYFILSYANALVQTYIEHNSLRHRQYLDAYKPLDTAAFPQQYYS